MSATAFEISETANWLNRKSFVHNIKKPELLVSGVGQLQTAYSLMKQIHQVRPDLIIQAGIGGSSCSQDLGSLFAIESEQIADLGAQNSAEFQDVFRMGLADPDQYPFKKGKLPNPNQRLLNWSELRLREGTTVNEIKSTDSPVFKRFERPLVESMEGAALHYTALMENIPFLQIRAVSNEIGERNKGAWKLTEAISNLNKGLINLINKLETTDETQLGI
jgi:futalosine hydrolase